MNPDDHSTILFDGICNFCNSAVNFIIKRDKNNKFIFTPIQSGAGKSIVDQLRIDIAGIDSLILIQEKTYYLKSTAFLKIILQLNGLWKLFYIFYIIPHPVRDFFYDIFARNRYKWFGIRDECMMPDEEVKERFLS